MGIKFTKMSGSGNDFIMIDNRVPVLESAAKRDFVRKVCTPKTSIGADGVIFIENSDEADFKWDYYNADGSSAEMCGNGARCVARYAFDYGIAAANNSIETTAGIIQAEVSGAKVKIKLTSPQDFQKKTVEFEGKELSIDSINTGVPHAIVYCPDVAQEDIVRIGRGIRHHDAFAPAGTNVDFVQRINEHALKIRTYERGVEDETLACGTGVVASVLAASRRDYVQSPVDVETRGGETLKVEFQQSNGTFGDVYLEGLTKITFDGTIGEL